MSLAASVLIDVARGILMDASGVVWSDADLLAYLNEGVRATVFVKPDAYTVQGYVSLISGTLQQLPDDGVAILDITRNEVSGRVTILADKELLDSSNRFWPAGTEEVDVENWAADPRNPRRFIVSPPNNGTGSVETLYGAVPEALATTASLLPLPDTYQTVLTNFILFRAYAVTSKRYDPTKSQTYLSGWGQLLGLKSQAQIAVAARVSQSQGA